MGLASALSTALTGLNAAETTIDVVGNNVANSNTVGFKSSTANFATQFLQTQSLGSAPTDNRGGTNPRQIGLGTKVAEITPNFTQGTIQISNSPTDLAIQGDGFFIVEGSQKEQFYSRNGIFKTNSDNELVTITGQRLLGHGVDQNFTIQESDELVPLAIPLGQAAVSQATKNVTLAGTFTPTGKVAANGNTIQSRVLIDGTKEFPNNVAGVTLSNLSPPDVTAATIAGAATGGAVPLGNYTYKIVPVTAAGLEGSPSAAIAVVTSGVQDSVQLDNLPALGSFASYNIYRADGSGTYKQVGTGVVPGGGVDFTDSSAAGTTAIPTTVPQGSFSYYITFAKSGGIESRPSQLLGPVPITLDGRRIQINGIPQPLTGDYDRIRIYRNLSSNDSEFHEIADLPLGATSFIDGATDAAILVNPKINLDGPPATAGVALTDIVVRDGNTYTHPFVAGTLSFAGAKGGRSLAEKTLAITNTTTLSNLTSFMEDAFGIQTNIPDPANPSSTLAAGGRVDAGTGRIVFDGNRGTGNAVEVGLSALKLTPTGGNQQAVNLGFSETTAAVGESATTDFIVYDSLGIPIKVRVTAVLESESGSQTTYRWFADSGDNSPGSGSVAIALGSGQVTFDGFGKVSSGALPTVAVQREGVPSAKPLEFKLDFNQVSGLAASKSTLAATRQDGSAAGKLTSFIIGEDGLIRGVFSNGITRDLGQVVLARFANNAGLEQRGENLFTPGVNSGLPIKGSPGDQGIGTIVAGAVELSNTDIGKNLIELITASTQYRGGARVITSVQQLLDELLNLRR